ncbi:GNAT family acetyltransferase [Halonotius terrestris]|uniref:GNAT family acetyltransferase n=1 Tax=Halonotius terrestris TaxID=2487750 RepID=A0A8J8TCZ2_9EURY|nr:DUF5816 domain-containing protein [Halonotius terrestris]TQQ82684.1 GNAT family acetyltransferase [Halonotius terrestris]
MDLDAATTEDGETVYIDRNDAERGSVGPFHPVYEDEAGTDRWGYYCSGCEGFDNAMDTMGRIVCNACENVRKPDEWDAAHE